MIGAVEGGAFIASRLVEMLLVWLHVVEGVGRREFAVHGRQYAERRRHAVRPTPFGQALIAVEDLARLEFVHRLGSTTTPRAVTACVFCGAALLDRRERQVKIAAGLRRFSTKTASMIRPSPTIGSCSA